MMSQNQSLKEICERIQNLQSRIINFLTNSKSVVITRDEYMKCYDSLFRFFHSNHCSMRDMEFFIKWYESSLDNYIVKNILPALQTKTEEPLIDEFFAQWNNFKIFVSIMKKVLDWFDSHALPSLLKTTLCNMSYGKFRTKIYEFMNTTMFKTLYDFLQREREQGVIPKNKVKKMIEIYETLGCMEFNVEFNGDAFTFTSKGGKNQYFIRFFEANLINELRKYYTSKSDQWLKLSVPEYINTALKFLHFEEKQCDFYYQKSKNLVKEEFVAVNNEKLIKNPETGVFQMLEKRYNDDLAQIFEFMNQGGEKNLRNLGLAFSTYIEQLGNKIIDESKASKDPTRIVDDFKRINKFFVKVFTTRVITLKKEMDQITSGCFKNHYNLQQSRDTGFKSFLNRFDKSPIHLAYYLDFQFSQGIKGVSEDEIEDLITSVTKLIYCLSSKDAFISSHRKLLCKRLINNRSLSFDTEKNLVSKLSDECGIAAVYPISSMLSDVVTSEEHRKLFAEKKPNNPIEVLVCSSTWPNLVPNPNTNMPGEMKDYTTEFEQFYKQLPMYQSKVLAWILSEGKGEIFAHFGNAKYMLDVKTYQISILLRFNEISEYTYEKLKELTGITDEILNEYLKIFTSKVPIMKRENPIQKKENFGSNERIFINADFKSDKKKIPCFSAKSQRSQAEKADLVESKQAQKQLDQQRELALDAMIVRIMKSRRILMFNEILSEINKLSTLFQPQPEMIRERIDSLIERDFLKRDDNDS